MKYRKCLVAAALAAVLFSAPGYSWGHGEWALKRKISLDASAVHGLTHEVKRATVLVRLHSGVLDFTKVKRDGSDLRFIASDDETPLNFHIERFDPVAEIAVVWVEVPEVSPGSGQDIWLYYGNDKAQPVANSHASFDGEQSLVLHFGENVPVPADATANANKLSAVNTTPTLSGVAAGAMSMNAQSRIVAAPSASLAIHANAKMTWSAWIKPSADQPQAGDGGKAPEAAVFTKFGAGGENDPVRLTLGLRGGAPFVRLGGSVSGEVVAPMPLPAGSWSHVAFTADERGINLYINGTAVGRFDALLPELSGEGVVGAAGGLESFVGDIDEVGQANTARSPSYIALMSQGQSRSSAFAAATGRVEDASDTQHDYLRVLFSALTPDAWAVIVVLFLMLMLSWMVMISKARFLGRVRRANKAFLAAYDAEMTRLGARAGLAGANISTQSSSLSALFEIAQHNLRQRMIDSNTSRDGTGYVATAQSVAAIRSAMDTGTVRQIQRLNKRMVLLTIAISGGPFIGLFGTVLGVMITFASVAAVGEVNVTAIAPGIAAALLATVTGLAVAIPALFGYNYLLSRVEEITADNQVFVDELEKRIAEIFSETSPAAGA